MVAIARREQINRQEHPLKEQVALTQLLEDPLAGCLEVGGIFYQVETIAFDDEFGSELVPLHPVIIVAVQIGEIILGDLFFVVPTPHEYSFSKPRDRAPEIDHEIRWLEVLTHDAVEIQIIGIVAGIERTLLVQPSRKNIGIFINASILNRTLGPTGDSLMGLKPMIQKKHLERKRPARHVRIEVAQVWIVGHRLKMRTPTEAFRQKLCQCCFSGANVSRDGDKDLRMLNGLIP